MFLNNNCAEYAFDYPISNIQAHELVQDIQGYTSIMYHGETG